MSAYRETVQRLTGRELGAGVRQGELVDPFARGGALAAKVIIFGTTALIPSLLAMLAVIGLVMLLARGATP